MGHINIMGAEDVSQGRENPAHRAITPVEREKRKFGWKICHHQICFRKGGGPSTERNVEKKEKKTGEVATPPPPFFKKINVTFFLSFNFVY